jgi:hypothetical protein
MGEFKDDDSMKESVPAVRRYLKDRSTERNGI